MTATRDASHWLYKNSPREWMRAAIEEVERAEAAFAQRDRKGAMASCRRAAGMALNALLALEETASERYGRSYMEHLAALVADAAAPAPVREAAKLLVQTPMPGGEVVVLRTVTTDQKLVEATKDVMAYAYAALIRDETAERLAHSCCRLRFASRRRRRRYASQPPSQR